MDRPATIAIQVGVGDDAEPDEVARATDQLQRELLDLDVDRIERTPAAAPPPGTRGIDAAALGGLIVTVTGSRLFSGVLDAVRAWLAGSSQRSITLQIDGDVLELSGLSAAEQTRLADEWLARHAAP